MSTRRVQLLLFAVTGLLSASYGVMFTVLAEYRDRYGIGDAGVGAIVAAGFFTSFVAQLTLAPLADRGHARRLVLAGTLTTVVGTLGMAFGNSLGDLLAALVVL